MFLGELDPEAIGPAIEFATHYEPTPLADFEKLMKAVPAKFDFRAATFVDVGSGMGRVLMLASHYPFKRIVGVEISPALHEIAAENVSLYSDARQECRDIRLVRDDASNCDLPPGNLVVYLYNPFGGPAFQTFIENLEARNSGEAMLIYHTPVERAALERMPAFMQCADVGCGVLYWKR